MRISDWSSDVCSSDLKGCLQLFTGNESIMSEVQDFIRETVTANPVVLFMKGTAQFPQCGFSGRAIQILKESGVTKLVTVNVLDDDQVRQGIKDYSNWPTIDRKSTRLNSSH